MILIDGSELLTYSFARSSALRRILFNRLAKTMKLITKIVLVVSCLWVSCLTGCSLDRKKSGGKPSPTPSTQYDNDPNGTSSSSSTESNEQTSEPAVDSQVADDLHTPAKGTSERQALMDALREAFDNPRSGYYRPHRGSIVFVVNKLNVHNGWAWTYAEPRSSDAGDSFGENSGFLLHQEGEQWKVMKLPPMVEDQNDPENLDYPTRKDVERIRKVYPSIATDIFQK
jgi:hypothetical protein